jgi:hypothetical protein
MGKSSRSALQKEIGAGGVAFYNGQIDNDEFNSKLTGTEGTETYDRMRRSDAQVAALVNAVQLPVESADWDVELPQDEREAEKITDEMLDFARYNMFTLIDYQAFLRHATSCVWPGFSFFEIVYALKEGRLVFGKIAPRLATSLYNWLTDGRGDLEGIQQQVWLDGAYQYPKIPRDKIALFTYNKEGNNYEGQSLLRPVFKHFFIKDELYRLDAIRSERYAVGVPKFTLPENYDDDLFAMMEAAGAAWRGAEQSFIILPNGAEVEILQVDGGQALDLVPMITHHNEEIMKVGLAQFISLGTTQTGSRSLGEVFTDFFYDAEESFADMIARSIEREVLWPLMDLNYPNKPRPRMVYKDLGAVALGEMVETLEKVGERYIRPSIDIENDILERLNLPVREDDEDFEPPETPPELPEQEEMVHLQTISETEIPEEEKEFWRALRPVERHVALRQITGVLDDSRDKLMRTLISSRDDWADPIAQQVREKMPEGPKALNTITIPDDTIPGIQGRVTNILDYVYDFGAEQVVKELASQAEEMREELRDDSMDADDISELIEARSEFITTRLKRKTEEAARAIAAGMYRTVGPDDFDEADVMRLMDEVFDTVEQEAKLTASYSVSEALNMGRDASAQDLIEQIRVAEYSAILDQNTCENCQPVDGTQTSVGSPAYYDLMPPLNSARAGSCLGKGRCRCMWVYILKRELRLTSCAYEPPMVTAADLVELAQPDPVMVEHLARDSTPIQAFLFTKEEYALDEAVAWIQEHDYHMMTIEDVGAAWRVRQFPRQECAEGSFHTLSLGSGIIASYCLRIQDIGPEAVE